MDYSKLLGAIGVGMGGGKKDGMYAGFERGKEFGDMYKKKKEEKVLAEAEKSKATRIKESFKNATMTGNDNPEDKIESSDENNKMNVSEGDEAISKFLAALSEKYGEEEETDEDLELLKEALLKLKG